MKDGKTPRRREGRRPAASVALVLGLLVPAAATAAERVALPDPSPPTIETLEREAERLVELQAEIAAERERARRFVEDTERQQRLLERQKTVLTERLTSLEERVAIFEARAARLQSRREEAEAELARWRAAARDAVPMLDRFPLPAALSAQAAAPLPDPLPAIPDAAATAREVEDLCARLDRVHAFSERFSASETVIDPPGGPRRKCDILFAGFAQAFALAPDRHSAWTGRLTPDGWRWRPADSAAPAILRALRMVRRRAAPERVDLPFSTGETAP